MRERLRRINKDNKVIEYTLFQPGMFMEYAGYPRSTTTHVLVLPMPWSIDPGRVVIIDGHQDDVTTMTTVGDIARVVRRAIEYEGEWPEVGGIAGQYITARQFKETVEKVTGMHLPMIH